MNLEEGIKVGEILKMPKGVRPEQYAQYTVQDSRAKGSFAKSRKDIAGHALQVK
jgi:hypothetical protein